ncbi:MAG TPA: hypothetical protein VFC32_01975 [Pseudolabrys sp.]|nr:hypothetical protein [Pseudolabrys sp.]
MNPVRVLHGCGRRRMLFAHNAELRGARWPCAEIARRSADVALLGAELNVLLNQTSARAAASHPSVAITIGVRGRHYMIEIIWFRHSSLQYEQMGDIDSRGNLP